MGKRSNKEAKAHRMEVQRALKKQERQHTLKIVIATLSVILALTLLITGGVFTGGLIKDAYLDSGKGYRKIVSYKSENFEINNAMLTYYFYDYLYDEILEKLGLDHPEELKEQTFTLSDEDGKNEEKVTYFTYYNEIAARDFQTDLLYAEAALDAGLTLNEKDASFIANRLRSFEKSASSLGVSVKEYLASRYGRGVTLSDIEDTLKITMLADKQYAKSYGGQNVSDEEIRNYLDTTNLNYTKIDYYLYDLLIPENASDEQKEAVRQKAEKLTNCKTDEEFLTELRAQITEEYKNDEDFDEKLVDEMVESSIYTEFVQEITDKTGKLDAFIHDPARKQGDSYLSVGTKSYGVVRIAKERYSTDTPLDTLRIIRFDFENYPSKAEALSAFNALKKSLSPADLEAFSAAAKRESHDYVTAIQNGYYVLKNKEATLSALLAGKLENAKAGDILEVSNEKSIWLVFYCGKGKTVSEIDAEIALRTKKFNAEVNGFADKYEMTYDTSKIYKIAPLKALED